MITVEEQLIDKLTETFYFLLKGGSPSLIELPSDYPDNELKQLVSYINRFLAEYNAYAKLALDISKGELFLEPPEGKTKVASAVKSIQSNLKHLIWQTQQIAKGDLNQAVDFMGVFSQVFSSMTQQLKDALEKIKIQERLENLQKILEGTIMAIVKIVEMRDPYTSGHQQRVAKLSCAIAKEMGFTGEQISVINMATLIHDIGKIYIPTEILSRPGRLNETEFKLVKIHPQVGYDVLKEIGFLSSVAKIVHQHHERMDGSGYPQCLSSEDILLEVKILGVADVVEAMSSHRPYRPARGIDKALEEISKNKGILYDPQVVDVCLKLFYDRGFKFSEELLN